MNNKPIFFPGLNGLRTLAALSVVISHTTLALGKFNLNANFFGMFKNGEPNGLAMAGYGVTIFFVLSGFLITFLLITEKKLQPISIRKFYMRRILRIWPLYYLYLTISIVVILIFGLKLNIHSLFFYLFYAANVPFIINNVIPFIGHYWSLGVEEQFYLFWPWVIKKIKNLIPINIALIVILFGTKILLHFLFPGSIIETAIQVTRFHCMMIGGLGAIFYSNNNKLFLFISNNKITQVICWMVIFLLIINIYHLASVIDHEIISLVTICIIIGQVKIKNRIINLDTKVLDFLGKISYGIYVIHPLVIFFMAHLLNRVNIPDPTKYVVVYISIISFTIFLSWLSYTYFEKYFMNLKKKFEVVKSSANRI
ncbi:MAG TPA: acyltransferase [Ferruginibacter sp.]|nr:acyltransferase [Ferruginibacter sp.]